MILCCTWIFWSHWYWMNYTSLWEMRLCHFCLLWAIYVYFFFDTLSLVTPLSLLISLSFLKPLSIVFQDGIWSVCFNLVVCTRIQKKNEKKKEEKEKRKSVKKKKIKRVLIKFWEVKWKEGILLWRRRRGEKKNVEWKFQKELTLLSTFTHFYFIPFAFTLHYVLIKSLFDLEDCVVQILICLRRKRCGVNIFGILSWD